MKKYQTLPLHREIEEKMGSMFTDKPGHIDEVRQTFASGCDRLTRQLDFIDVALCFEDITTLDRVTCANDFKKGINLPRMFVMTGRLAGLDAMLLVDTCGYNYVRSAVRLIEDL